MNNKINTEYEKALKNVLENGNHKPDRTNTGTTSFFGLQMRFNLEEGFPLITTKKVHMKSIIHELLWFLQGTGNIKYLKDNGVKIWDAWDNGDGELGPVYGVQWRHWKGSDGQETDQIAELIKNIKENPHSRRHILTAWNVAEINKMALAPCHMTAQFYVNDGKLSCQLYQRSGDMFLGIPFNIASYSLLTHMMAQQTGLQVGDFIHTIGDAHIYDNHREQVELQLSRVGEAYSFPELVIKRHPESIDDYVYDDFEVVGYESHAGIKAPVAV